MEKKSLKVGDDFTDCYGGEYEVSSVYVEDGVVMVGYSSDDYDYSRPLDEILPMIRSIGEIEYSNTRKALLIIPSNFKRNKWQDNKLKSYFEITEIVTLPSELQTLWDSEPDGTNYPWNYLESIKGWLQEKSNIQDLVWVENQDLGKVTDLICWCMFRERKAIYTIGNSNFRYYPLK